MGWDRVGIESFLSNIFQEADHDWQSLLDFSSSIHFGESSYEEAGGSVHSFNLPPSAPAKFSLFTLLLGGCSIDNKQTPYNTDPTATINEPVNGSTFYEGEEITFLGEGGDTEDDNLSDLRGVWSSSIDGTLSDGPLNEDGTFSFTTVLSGGDHTIEFKVQDTDGEWSEVASASSVHIKPNQAPSVTIDSVYDAESGTQNFYSDRLIA